LRVVKLARCLPIIKIVTSRAVPPQLALMPVDVAGEAIAGEAQKSAIQIPDLDGSTFRGQDVR
jgi:hypothetical protein